jgi:coenzyme F420 hydrogenase subunit beta
VETQDYASLRLRTDVIDRGLCSLCGGCASGCPYIGEHNGRIVQLDSCPLSEGSCYRNCPRTLTNLDELSRSVFGEPFSPEDIGIVRGAYLARATNPEIRSAASGGGVVQALLQTALSESDIDAVIGTVLMSERSQGTLPRNLAAVLGGADTPAPTLATSPDDVLRITTAPHHTSRVLAGFNSIPGTSEARLGMACLPCQVASMRKRLGHPADNRADAANVRLLIAEFCAAKRWLEPGEDRQSANKACSYCWDLTGELADISVGAARGHQDWNTVFVRTAAGQRAFEAACKSGAMECQPLPADNMAQEKKASRDKKRRALKNLTTLSGSKDRLSYLGASPRVLDALEGGS